jgi:hypothetical protein
VVSLWVVGCIGTRWSSVSTLPALDSVCLASPKLTAPGPLAVTAVARNATAVQAQLGSGETVLLRPVGKSFVGLVYPAPGELASGYRTLRVWASAGATSSKAFQASVMVTVPSEEAFAAACAWSLEQAAQHLDDGVVFTPAGALAPGEWSIDLPGGPIDQRLLDEQLRPLVAACGLEGLPRLDDYPLDLEGRLASTYVVSRALLCEGESAVIDASLESADPVPEPEEPHHGAGCMIVRGADLPVTVEADGSVTDAGIAKTFGGVPVVLGASVRSAGGGARVSSTARATSTGSRARDGGAT